MTEGGMMKQTGTMQAIESEMELYVRKFSTYRYWALS